MTDFLIVKSYNPEFVHVTLYDVQGGKQLVVDLAPQVQTDLKWLREHRDRLNYEQTLRDENPVAKELFDQYTTYIKLTN